VNTYLIYRIGTNSVALLAMIWLGWMMRRHVRRKLTGVGGTEKRALELQAQLTWTLVIQVGSVF
jgi:hypothetical protein